MNPLRACHLLILGSILLRAQVAETRLTGTVTDEQGGRIPEAKVTATAPAMGLKRETLTTAQGTYVLAKLPIGLYRVEVSKPGFASYLVAEVKQEVGQTRSLDVTLYVAGRTESSIVSEAQVQVDRVDATVGNNLEPQEVSELPVNGRNWATLTGLVQGAIDNGAGDQRTIRFAGHGLDDNNTTLDGVDATAIFNQMQREYVRLTIPLESIDEFDVKAQNFGADVEGGTAGGQVAVVSPSGTNSLHGSLFEFFRSDYLEARTPFNGASPNPFQLNQFGGSLSGPIVKNQLFFFANYEGLRQRLDGTQIGLVPSQQFISAASAASPDLIPLLQAYPKGTSPTSDASVSNYEATGRQENSEDSGMIRLDYRFTERTTAFVRSNSDEAWQTIPKGNLTSLTYYDTKFNNGVVEILHVLNPRVVNEAKFGFNQCNYHSETLSPLFETLSVASFSQIPGAATSDYPSKTMSGLDDVVWTKGSHTLKFGFELRRIFLNQGSSATASLTYTSASRFLANIMGSASYAAVLPLVRQRKNQYWAYFEDEWKVNSHITVNAGVRYNFFNALHALDNQALPFDFATCGGFCKPSDPYFYPRYNDIDPRIGLAWALGNTVIRAGAGIYHTDGQIDDQNLPISNTVDRYSFSNTAFPKLSYPLDPFLEYAESGGLGVVSPRDLDRNRKDMYVAAWTASIQQSLPFNIIGSVNYLGNKGTYILTTTYTNLAQPPTNVAPYPAFGVVSWRGDVGNSTFQALQLAARRSFKNGLVFSTNYMWSHSINDGSIGGGEADVPQNSFCRACDKASSDNDIRHVFNLSAVYGLPFGAGKRFVNSPGLARVVLGNWSASTIFTAQTGLPVNIVVDRPNKNVPGLYSISGWMRPDLLPGVSLTPPGGSTPNQWINPAAFAVPANGMFGNLGRNAFRAPAISQLDLGLSKFLPFTERVSLRLRADLFNVLNRAQYGAPNADISQPNFGTITATISNYATGRGTPRELQLSAKIIF